MTQAGQRLESVQSNDGDLAVPIHFHEIVRGVIRLRKPGKQTWTPEEVSFVETVTNQLYMALENARLYQKPSAVLSASAWQARSPLACVPATTPGNLTDCCSRAASGSEGTQRASIIVAESASQARCGPG